MINLHRVDHRLSSHHDTSDLHETSPIQSNSGCPGQVEVRQTCFISCSAEKQPSHMTAKTKRDRRISEARSLGGHDKPLTLPATSRWPAGSSTVWQTTVSALAGETRPTFSLRMRRRAAPVWQGSRRLIVLNAGSSPLRGVWPVRGHERNTRAERREDICAMRSPSTSQALALTPTDRNGIPAQDQRRGALAHLSWCKRGLTLIRGRKVAASDEGISKVIPSMHKVQQPTPLPTLVAEGRPRATCAAREMPAPARATAQPRQHQTALRCSDRDERVCPGPTAPI